MRSLAAIEFTTIMTTVRAKVAHKAMISRIKMPVSFGEILLARQTESGASVVLADIDGELATATADWRESHNATASNVLEVRRACYRLSLTPASNRVGAGCPQVQSLRLGSFASRFSCSRRLLVSYPRTGEKVMGRSAPVCQI
jgi:hypothetical protein